MRHDGGKREGNVPVNQIHPDTYRAAKAPGVRTAMRPHESESAQLLAAPRANQQLLRDLILRYDACHTLLATLCNRSVALTISSPQDVWDPLGEEMSGLVQEQI